MNGILDFGVANQAQYVKKVNDCLDYIRKNFNGFDLCYKAHPADDGEQTFLDLNGFRILQDKVTAEVFLAENHKKIKSVFAISSLSTFNAFNMGLDTHVFYRLFFDIYGHEYIPILNDMFFEMPESFFIKDLQPPPVNNASLLQRDDNLVMFFKKILAKRKGKVWIYCSFSEHLITLIILSQMIKNLSLGRPVSFIASHHNRWDRLKEYMDKNFDEVVFFPRVHYSLKPGKLMETIKVARQVKNLGISSDDILIVVSQPDFVENCLISYHKNKLRIGIITQRDLNTQYNTRSLTYTINQNFRFNKASWFFNRLFEPLLGLYRSLYLSFTEMKGFYFNRFQKPVNELFDHLIVFQTCRTSQFAKNNNVFLQDTNS